MITPELVLEVMKSSGKGIDSFGNEELSEIKQLSGVTLSLEEIRKKCIGLRKAGKIGSSTGRKTRPKTQDLVCPHCGKRYGDKK